MLRSVFDWMEDSAVRSVFDWMDVSLPGSIFLRESSYGYAAMLVVHALSMGIFFGLIVMMDLRLVGIGNRRTTFSELQKSLFPWQMGFMALNSVSGLLLFYSQPMRYYPKMYFWMKLGVMVLAGLNALAFHQTTYRWVAAWDRNTWPPLGARVAGVLSIALWSLVLIFGRLTAYEWLTYPVAYNF